MLAIRGGRSCRRLLGCGDGHRVLCGRGLVVWSEMFSDGVLGLDAAGALDPDRPVTGSFAFGSAHLYDWIDRNPRIRMLRTEKVNDPGRIARQPQMVSINSALQVDLFAQANASRVRGVIYSGFGGQTDFVVGALHSPGGLAVIALPSWHPKANVSTVVPRLAGPVTSFQHSFIVSDQGTAAVWGHDASAQAQQIIQNEAAAVGLYDQTMSIAAAKNLHDLWLEKSQGEPVFEDEDGGGDVDDNPASRDCAQLDLTW